VTALLIPDVDDRADLGTFVGRAVRLDPAAVVRLRRTAGGRVTAWVTTPFDVLATRTVPASLDPDDVTTPATALLTALSVDRAEVVDPGVGGLWQGLLPPDAGWAVVDTVPSAELEALTERGLAVARENAGPLGPPASLLDQTVLTVSALSQSPDASTPPTGGGPADGPHLTTASQSPDPSTPPTPGGPVDGPHRTTASSQSPDASTPPTPGGPVDGPHLTTATVKVPLRCLFALSGMGFLGSSDALDETVRVSATASWLRLDARYGAVVRRRLTALPLLV
jgi:hypothetical protein